MTNHVSKSEMERFSLSALPQTELNSISEHLTTCQACHQLFVEALRREKGSTGLRFTIDLEVLLRHEHLEYEQLVGLADKSLDATDREIINAHLSACATCQERVRSFVAFKDELEPELRVRYGPAAQEPQPKKAFWADWWRGFAWNPAYAAAILLVVIGLVVALVVLRRRSATLEAKRTMPSQVNATVSPTPTLDNQAARKTSPTPAPAPSQQLPNLQPSPGLTVKNRQPLKVPNAQAVAVLNDEGRAVTIDKAGSVSGLDEIPQDRRREIVEALLAENIKAPATRTELAGGPLVLRGPANGPTFKLLSPARAVIISDRPSFEWEKLAGATSYRVSVGDLKGHELAKSEELPADQTRWTPPTSLKRGEIYVWEVEATIDAKRIVSPGTSAPQMRFKILSATSAHDLEQLKKARSHLALGVFYAHEGMVGEAEHEFQILIRDNPHTPVLIKLLKKIQSWQRQ